MITSIDLAELEALIVAASIEAQAEEKGRAQQHQDFLNLMGEKSCTCDPLDLFKGGCTCGAITPYQVQMDQEEDEDDEISYGKVEYTD